MTKEQIDKICKEYNITDYTINNDMSIDVNNNINLQLNTLEVLPIIFNKVNGSFFCELNNLNTLKYSPKYIEGNFNLAFNNIKTFEHFPEVEGDIIFDHNPIEELWFLFLDKNHIPYFNELDIIQENGEVVILDRLNYFLTDIGEHEIIKEQIEKYIVK